jgi:hypothetical protein
LFALEEEELDEEEETPLLGGLLEESFFGGYFFSDKCLSKSNCAASVDSATFSAESGGFLVLRRFLGYYIKHSLDVHTY